MSASKKQTTSAAKTTNTSQVFDIIPRSRVMPSASSRPIITNEPQQADNTLTAPLLPADQPLSSHRELKLDIPASASNADSSATDIPQAAKKTTIPSGGLTAEELKAKLAARAARNDEDQIDEEWVEDTIDDAVSGIEAEAAKATEVAETTDPIEPDLLASGQLDQLDQAKELDDQDAPTDLDLTDKETVDDSEDDTKPEETPAQQTDKTTLSEDETGLTDNSQELKDVGDGLQDVDDESLSSNDDKPRPHRELYGGKSVIVVHKHRRSAKRTVLRLVWLLLCLLLAVGVVDVLLDADIINIDYNIPHTNFL